jgi:hypothetical protein
MSQLASLIDTPLHLLWKTLAPTGRSFGWNNLTASWSKRRSRIALDYLEVWIVLFWQTGKRPRANLSFAARSPQSNEQKLLCCHLESNLSQVTNNVQFVMEGGVGALRILLAKALEHGLGVEAATGTSP